MDFFLCNTDLKKNIKMRTYNKQTKKKKTISNRYEYHIFMQKEEKILYGTISIKFIIFFVFLLCFNLNFL